LKNIIIIYAEKFAQILTGLLISYLVVNYFNTNDYGLYKYVTSLSLMFLVLVMMGFNLANIRYIPEHLLNKQFSKINYQIIFLGMLQIIMVIFLFSIFYALTQSNLVRLDENLSIEYIFLYLILLYLKSYFGESILIAFSKRTLLSSAKVAIYLVQLLIVFYAVSTDVNINEFIFFIAIFSAIEAIILCTLAFKVHNNTIENTKVEAFPLNLTFKYAANNYGFVLSNFLKDNAMTIIVVSYLYGYTEVAYYSVALLIPNTVRAFSPSKVFSGLLLPELVKSHYKQKNEQSIFSQLGLIAKINVIFFIPALIYSIVLYPSVIEFFFGNEYANNSYILSIYLFINVCLLGYLDLNFLAANVLERSDLVFKINLLSVVNILLLILFSNYGVNAIGIANVVSSMLTLSIFGFISQRIFKYRIKSNFFNIYIVIYSILLTTCMYVLSQFNILVFIMVFPVFACICAVKIIKSPFFTTQEYGIIAMKFPKIFNSKVSA